MGLPAGTRDDQIKHPSIPLLEFVPNPAPTALLIQVVMLDQIAQGASDRIEPCHSSRARHEPFQGFAMVIVVTEF